MNWPPKTELSEEGLVQYDGSDILLEISKCIKQEFVPSWLLARLWYLTEGGYWELWVPWMKKVKVVVMVAIFMITY